jgi:hypothetical protein
MEDTVDEIGGGVGVGFTEELVPEFAVLVVSFREGE